LTKFRKEKQVAVTVLMDEDVKKKLKLIAEDQRRTLSNTALVMLEEKIEIELEKIEERKND
jgi:predicted transcriptional regulator